MEKNTTWMVQKPQGSPPMITTWSTSGTPAWHRLFLRSHKKKKRLDLADCFGTFGSEFSSPGVALENWEKWWKKRYTPFLHSPKNNLGCIVCSLRCLDSMFYVFGVQSSRTSVSVILDVPEATIHTPPKHTVPPRNKGWIRPTIMGNTHSPISP